MNANNRRLRINRRWFLEECGVALGSIALHDLTRQAQAGQPEGAAPHSPVAHHRAKAKRVIYLFMAGAPSQHELFDFKPKLAELSGSLPPTELLAGYRAAFINPKSKLLGPQFKFARHGECGSEVSELLPCLAEVVDDIAIVKSMVTDAFNHAPGQILMSTGSQLFGRPSLGSWVTYGLGHEAADMPGFIVLSSGAKGPSGGAANWGSGFLPSIHQGVPFRNGQEPVLYLSNPGGINPQIQRDSLTALRRLNEVHFREVGDPEIATRINSYEMAFRMQASAPKIVDLSGEPRHILDMYGAEPGASSFANNCLLARRLVEHGVRFVELFHESWDQHDNLVRDLKKNCRDTDRACAALITDLKQRGLLEDTLVVWGGEFGRTPMVEGKDGRDHHPNAFTMWLAGGGIRPGITLGETDELGFNATKERMHVHDLHATILHLLGVDHTRLTYRFQGRDFRLTDVRGNVVTSLLA
ncbi:MAG: DUF1501 domain-containing protein [Planctomycetaceae bacterium]